MADALKPPVNTQKKMWRLKYRQGSILEVGVIEARSEALAFNVAQAFCNQNPDRRYVSIAPYVLADESILAEESAEPQNA